MQNRLDAFERLCKHRVGWLVRVAWARGIAIRIERFDTLGVPAGTRGYFVKAPRRSTLPYEGLIMVNAKPSDNSFIEELWGPITETSQSKVSSAAHWFDIVFTILHELGHATLHENMNMLVYASDPDYHDARETEADQFAADFLQRMQEWPDMSPADGCMLCDDLRQLHQRDGRVTRWTEPYGLCRLA